MYNALPPSVNSPDSVLSVQGLTIRSGEQTLVNDLSFFIQRQQTLAIVGESGSGKSISSLALLGLLPDSISVQGEVYLAGLANNEGLLVAQCPSDSDKQRKQRHAQLQSIRGARIGMIFQEPMTALNPLHTVAKQLAESLRLAGLSKAQIKPRLIELLDDVNIKDPATKLKRFPHELSGGQRQRVMIAMALAQQPDVLIADEPTTALDVTLQHEILALLDRLKEKHGMAMLLISHDLNLVRRYSAKIIVMRQGEVIEQGQSDNIFANPESDYTKSLISQTFGRPLIIDYTLADNASIGNVIESIDLTVAYPVSTTLFGKVAQWTKAVKGIDFVLPQGQALGIVGESGSGKTTIALALTRLLTHHAKVTGTIQVDGTDINSLSKRSLRQFRATIQMVFQDPFASINPRFTVLQIVEEGLLVQGIDKQQREMAVMQALQTVQLPSEFAQRYPHQLSGGQRQRVALARALVMTPKVIILDEPTSALDSTTQVAVVDLLRDIQAESGISYIFISHDLNVVQALCQHVLVMNAGECVEQATTDALFNNPQHPYSKLLIETSVNNQDFS